MLVLAVLLGYGALLLIGLHAWWWTVVAVPLVILAMVALYLMFDNLVLAERDAKGNRKTPEPESTD